MAVADVRHEFAIAPAIYLHLRLLVSVHVSSGHAAPPTSLSSQANTLVIGLTAATGRVNRRQTGTSMPTPARS